MSWTTSVGTGKFITKEELAEMMDAFERHWQDPSQKDAWTVILPRLYQKYKMPSKGMGINLGTGEFQRDIQVPDEVCDEFYACTTQN